jgi:type III pantothenate kinase
MILLVDVGNTALKLALYHKGEITLTSLDVLQWHTINQVIYSNVASTDTLHQLLTLASDHKIACQQAVVTAQCADVVCGYENFQTLGVDRWLVVLACVDLFISQKKCRNVIIVDAGTATTIDVVDQHFQHLGGWIIPGLELMVDSVTSRTEQVFVDHTTPFISQFGRDTPAALKNGCLAATLGAVQMSLNLTRDDALIVFTGGYGEFLQQEFGNLLPNRSCFNDSLIFKGLVVWAKNHKYCV